MLWSWSYSGPETPGWQGGVNTRRGRSTPRGEGGRHPGCGRGGPVDRTLGGTHPQLGKFLQDLCKVSGVQNSRDKFMFRGGSVLKVFISWSLLREYRHLAPTPMSTNRVNVCQIPQYLPCSLKCKPHSCRDALKTFDDTVCTVQPQTFTERQTPGLTALLWLFLGEESVSGVGEFGTIVQAREIVSWVCSIFVQHVSCFLSLALARKGLNAFAAKIERAPR